MGQKTGLWQPRREEELKRLKLLRPLAGYTLHEYKTNNSIRKELRTTSILDKRRIQKEMASTHTKNATKPNPFQIIQLQTARKKIYWTT